MELKSRVTPKSCHIDGETGNLKKVLKIDYLPGPVLEMLVYINKPQRLEDTPLETGETGETEETWETRETGRQGDRETADQAELAESFKK